MMEKTKKIKQLYENFCVDYDKHMDETGHYKAQLILLNEFAEYVQQPILDIACGPGFLLHKLSKNFSLVYANDFSEEMIKLAKHKNPNIKFTKDDAEKLSSYNKFKFNTLICSYLFFYIQNKSPTLKRWKELLNENGKLVILEEYPFIISNSSSNFSSCKNELLTVVHPLSPEEMVSIVSENGFSLVKKIKAKIDEKHDMYGFIFEIKISTI